MIRFAFSLAVLLLGLGSAAAAAPAQGASSPVTVSYVGKVSDYVDASIDGWRSSKSFQRTQDKLTAIFDKLGATYLSDGQRLEIEILDIDLAGRFEPWALQQRDVRILREITWPRITLRYKLYTGEALTLEGTEDVSDMSYLSRVNMLRSDNDALRYEREMLKDWFKLRLVDRRPGPESKAVPATATDDN